MKLTMRNYRGEDDYCRIRDFLRNVLAKNDYFERSWHVNRFDYWRWHGVMNMGHGCLETDVFIWETDNGDLAAALNREAPGSVFLQIHPDYRSAELEEQMISVAEMHLTVPAQDNARRLHIWVEPDDQRRLGILKSRGYIKSKRVEYQRRRSVSVDIPDVPLADGYSIRSMSDTDDLRARSWVSWRAFHPDEPAGSFEGWTWYDNIQRAPLYRRDLDIIAIAPDGKFAAFATVWFDPATRTAVFEPVGTAPEHQRRGLARAVMTEGLKRLRNLDAIFAYVGSWGEATHALYGDTMGFTDYIILEAWEKRLYELKSS